MCQEKKPNIYEVSSHLYLHVLFQCKPIIMSDNIPVLVLYSSTGRQQVMIGVVPINVSHASSESCKSVYPVAIANCEENR